jgi:hypothetical protein
LNFLDRVLKNTQISKFLNTRPVGVELFHAGGRNDGRQTGGYDESNAAAFRNYAEAPKIILPAFILLFEEALVVGK